MAKALLKAWKAPAVVTTGELDAETAKATRTENTDVTTVSKEAGLSWDEMDRALPMPLDLKDPGVALAVKASDVEQALDEEMLRIHGLPAKSYKLSIDGEEVGTFAAAQLESGINLAMQSTPMTRQAADVHALTLKHNNIHAARWRNVQVALEKDDLAHKQAAVDALDLLENDIVKRQRAAAQPKPHHYSVVAVPE